MILLIYYRYIRPPICSKFARQAQKWSLGGMKTSDSARPYLPRRRERP